MASPKLITPIPEQLINIGAAYGPFDLNAFIQADDGSPLHFTAELSDGKGLPKGMICLEEGMLTGIPAKSSEGSYKVKITARPDKGEAVTTEFTLTIKPALSASSNNADYLDQLKAQVWQAVDQKLPIPDLASLYERPITAFDVYYLLERWATLIIWDAINLEPPTDKQLLTLEDASPHYNVYDRGCCLIVAPKDLFSHERTLKDALQTARALAREVYKRGWVVEFAGFEKMERAAWVEFQHLEDQYGKKIEILRYDPSFKDLRIYTEEAREFAAKRMEQPG